MRRDVETAMRQEMLQATGNPPYKIVKIDGNTVNTDAGTKKAQFFF